MEKASSLTVSNSQRNSVLKLHVPDIQCLMSKQDALYNREDYDEIITFTFNVYLHVLE